MESTRSLIFLICLFVIVLSLPGNALVEIVPSSYTAPAGDKGWSWWNYDDSTGHELTDGIHGSPWRNEPGYPGENETTWRMIEWVA